MKTKQLVTLIITVILTMSLCCSAMAASYTGYQFPTDTQKLSRGYSSGHKGLDIAASSGSSVYATKSGTVYYVYSGCNNNNAAKTRKSCSRSTGCTASTYYSSDYGVSTCNWGYGNGIVLKLDDGTYALYAHMSSVSVSKGQRVSKGQVIGKVGSTGLSTGAHLHFSLVSSGSMSGTYFKPTAYIDNNINSGVYGNGSGSSKPETKVTVTFKSCTEKEALGKNTATMARTVYITGYSGSQVTVGFELMDARGHILKKVSETGKLTSSGSGKQVRCWYNIGSGKEVNVKLSSKTRYTYRFFCVVNGKTYYSDTASFTTK